MIKIVKTICTYKQYECCGNSACALFNTCSVMPITSKSGIKRYGLKKCLSVPKRSEKEKETHKKLYYFYNRFFGDAVEKRCAYNKKYYREHREEILRKKRREPLYKLLCVQKGYCDENCFQCKFDDCIIPEIKNKKQYNKLYYQMNHDKLIEQKAAYREAHRAELNQKSKEYYKKNKEARKKRNAEYRKTHKEERKEYDALRNQDSEYLEKRKEYDRKYRERHREEIRERNRVYMQNKRISLKGEIINVQID